eukprot:TRINITY_DN0_c1729_g1_i2.p1 TRINITY_DN0_c1729_g1~~TRINITY_DN0_c1729_g1_i2.p1  ORF type:complete len:151 (+),score=37.92 TRINITY_DN0_c1729_g1_i2:33-485(+)
MWFEGCWSGKGKVVNGPEYDNKMCFTKTKDKTYLFEQSFVFPSSGFGLTVETGYLRIHPNKEDSSKGKAELIVCGGFGACLTHEGTYEKGKIDLNSTGIIRTSTAKQPFVTETKRRFFNSNGQLLHEMDLGSTAHEIRPHLNAQLSSEKK